jgi:hypothetical protein
MRIDADALAAHRWGLVAADEAQHVKNPASGAALALLRLSELARREAVTAPTMSRVGRNTVREEWAGSAADLTFDAYGLVPRT